jgi:hypothetical protein
MDSDHSPKPHPFRGVHNSTTSGYTQQKAARTVPGGVQAITHHRALLASTSVSYAFRYASSWNFSAHW